MTARDMIERALRLIGALAAGEPMTASEAQDGLRALQAMVNEWGAQRLTMYQVQRLVFPLVVNQVSYTIGPGGNFNTVRPEWIENASVVQNNGALNELELRLDPIMNAQAWRTIMNKRLTSTLPTKLFYDPTFPLGTLYFWPILQSGTLHTALYIPLAIAGFTNLTTDFTFPPAYEKALTYNLALELAPEFGAQVPEDVKEQAQRSLGRVKTANANMDVMSLDPALYRTRSKYGWDWRTGD